MAGQYGLFIEPVLLYTVVIST